MNKIKDNRGQGLVEFALVFPLLILLVVVLFDGGRAVFTYNSLTNAAREGARLAIVNQDPDLVRERIEAIAFAPTPSITVTYMQSTPNSDPASNPPCASIAVGCVAVVSLTSPYTPITPIVGAVWPSMTLTARSQLTVELVCPNPDIPAFSTVGSCPRQP